MTAPGVPRDDRFWSKVEPVGECLIWRGTSSGGYGRFAVEPRMVQAHRFAYEERFGAIPAGLTLDHLCRVKLCVNPDHLEPVTHRENTLRGVSLPARNHAKTHCEHGHQFSVENTYWYQKRGSWNRQCRACRRARHRRLYWRNPDHQRERRAARLAATPAEVGE